MAEIKEKIGVILWGTGRMGQVLKNILEEDSRFYLKDQINSRNLKEKLQTLPGDLSLRNSDENQAKDDLAVVIDFSAPAGVEDLLDFCLERRLPLVGATTGYEQPIEEVFGQAKKTIPIVYASNYSQGVYLLNELTRQASKVCSDWDVEIIETHHNLKQDAPSGSALTLRDTIQSVREELTPSYGRYGAKAKRKPTELGMHSIRGGTVPGEHRVLFLGDDELVEIRHLAFSRRIFALGALEAAARLVGKPPALYELSDLY